MSLVPNPEYAKAPFELAYKGPLSEKVVVPEPLRFKTNDVRKVMELLKAGQWDELRALAIPSHIPAPPSSA